MIMFTLPGIAQSPTVQDCAGAIPVCDTVYSSSTPYSGSGNIPDEVNSSISCLGNGEQNSVWYTFTTQSGGDLSFTIFPNNASNDYDWALFNLTNASCSDIFTDASLLVSCNFAPIPGPTGANGGPLPHNRPVVPVQPNETYALIITNFSQTQQDGYRLSFSASTAQIFDNTPPEMLEILTPIPCNASSITLRLSENVSCSSVTTNSFTLTGPNGTTHQITGISSPNCSSGAPFSNTYTLQFSPQLADNGQYSLAVSGSITDLCGNALTAANSIPLLFDYAGLIVDSTFSTMADCLQNNGSAGISITGGLAPLTYQWSPSGQTTPIATNLYAGTYTVRVADQNNCRVTETVTISNPINFALSYTQVPDTCAKGNGTITVTATGTSGPYTFEWSTPGADTSSTLYTVTGNDSLVLRATDADGCVITDTVGVQNIQNDSIVARFVATPNPVDLLFPQTKLLNTSEHYVSYLWEYLDIQETSVLNPVITLPNWGDYPVSLTVYDQNGCYDETSTVIEVRGNVYYYIPDAFTPDGDGLNETWYPQGVGFHTNSYKMTICDRWGNIMYESHDTDFGWDGNDREGKLCPVGVYVYKITMEGFEGMLPIFHGSIMLIR